MLQHLYLALLLSMVPTRATWQRMQRRRGALGSPASHLASSAGGEASSSGTAAASSVIYHGSAGHFGCFAHSDMKAPSHCVPCLNCAATHSLLSAYAGATVRSCAQPIDGAACRRTLHQTAPLTQQVNGTRAHTYPLTSLLPAIPEHPLLSSREITSTCPACCEAGCLGQGGRRTARARHGAHL